MKKSIFILACAFFSTLGFAQNQIELLKDFHNGAGGYYNVGEMFTWEGHGLEFFTINSSDIGSELYVSDGTESGTKLLKDINEGEYSSYPEYFCAAGDFVYFRAYDYETGMELWKTDGTPEGTVLVDDLNPLGDATGLFHIGSFQNKVFFCASVENSIGYELCVSDGTPEGTQLFLNINALPSGGSEPDYFTEFNNKLYFVATDGINGRELWVTDGTVDGTTIFADIVEGSGSSMPRIMGTCGGYLYFTAYTDENGAEMYVTDGTVPGTMLLKDANPGNAGAISEYENCTCFDNNFFYTCDDGVNGIELWKSDGSSDGTALFADFNTWGASYSSQVNNLTVVNSKLYFTATTTELTYQNQLFESNGTPEGTGVYNNTPVEQLSNIQSLKACNDRLFIYGEHPQYFRLMSIGNNSSEIAEHGGDGIYYIDEENYGSMNYFFNINDTLCFLADFNNGIGYAWYRLYYDGSVDAKTTNNEIGVNVFPNPVSDMLNLNFTADEIYNVSLLDPSGKIILDKTDVQGNLKLDLINLSAGIYMLKISDKEQILIQKIIKY